jgi:tetratricopeptide (TPR) repeat protein
MYPRARIFVKLAVAMGLLVPTAWAQKPPAPAPPPPSTNPNRPALPSPLGSQPVESRGDLVMFLRGRVATDDGTPVPNDALVERVCNNRVRQQVYATHGDFSMQLGARSATLLDASGDDTQDVGANRVSETGISRRELINCELRASVSGFRSNVVSLMELTPDGSSMDVGAIVVHRTEKIKGMTLNAAAYKAPKDARKAFEKGIEAEKHGKLADARQYLEKAVEIYPKYTSAWFQLGMVLQKATQNEAARTAYTEATTIDSKFLPPYLSLASMAYEVQDWTQVLKLTNHVLDGDPLRYADITGYILDLDPLDYAEAYFYNSAANYRLNKIEDAEKSGLKAERLDVRPRFPQLHLLLAEIFARKNNYASAISETKIYLELAPHAKDADQVRERLAKLQRLNGPVPSVEKTDQN